MTLGLPWLRAHNARTDWRSGELYFEGNVAEGYPMLDWDEIDEVPMRLEMPLRHAEGLPYLLPEKGELFVAVDNAVVIMGT